MVVNVRRSDIFAKLREDFKMSSSEIVNLSNAVRNVVFYHRSIGSHATNYSQREVNNIKSKTKSRYISNKAAEAAKIHLDWSLRLYKLI